MKRFASGVVVVLLLATTGCDTDSMMAGPVAICTETAEQCQLPEGPLGVCERRPCLASDAGPCFVCVSQH